MRSSPKREHSIVQLKATELSKTTAVILRRRGSGLGEVLGSRGAAGSCRKHTGRPEQDNVDRGLKRPSYSQQRTSLLLPPSRCMHTWKNVFQAIHLCLVLKPP